MGAAAATHKEMMTDGAQILRHLGGREIAALVGAVMGARLNRIPVLLDGYVTGAAAAVLHVLNAQSNILIFTHLISKKLHCKFVFRSNCAIDYKVVFELFCVP